MLVLVAAGALLCPTAGAAKAPAPLSADRTPADVGSTFGSGSFGSWGVDGFGLPRYRYEIDQASAPQARQPELEGRTNAWHQLGDDHIVANAYNDGSVQLWSQDRVYQWANFAEPDKRHFRGGYGYLKTGSRIVSTLYPDRPGEGRTERDFGVGYARKAMEVDGLAIEEHVYAPFGDDPILLHDVTVRNTSDAPLEASWFEYWDVNPYSPGPVNVGNHRGLAAPAFDRSSRTLSVAQLPNPHDTDPLSIYAAALRGPVADFDTSTDAFFGAGTRARPAAVVAGRLSNSVALPVVTLTTGSTLFALRSPVSLARGERTTLRYAYGMAHARAIPGLVEHYREADQPLGASSAAWADWVPRVSLPGKDSWLAREMQWDAYMVRSGATYEETCGRHIISQGGYYQYDSAAQLAFRDPLQHMLPMIYAHPALARDVLAYSAQEQSFGSGHIPFGMIEMCTRFDLGSSNDLDVWLLLAAAEYGLATRDLRFFSTPIRYADAGSAPLWEHLKLAYRHQESQRGGPHGGYVTGVTGDWSDFSTQYLQMTESMLVPAQLAYVYPRLAELADALGDTGFAAQLRTRAAELTTVLRREWTGGGWFARGYSGVRRIGEGAIFGEPQPWAVLAAIPDARQARLLVANVRRLLTGVGAPPEVKGPARIGSSLSPARNDPAVTERVDPSPGIGDNNAVYQGGAWYAVNGWLTWALATLDGTVPHAREYAFDEWRRNTLGMHAHAFPEHWNGVISVDDVCWAHYTSDPSMCGNGGSKRYAGQIMHQPAWGLFNLVKLAGIEPTANGYRIDPHLPAGPFAIRLPGVGIARDRRMIRGYVRPESGGELTLRVTVPDDLDASRLTAWANGRKVRHRPAGGRTVVFRLRTKARRPADWAVTAPRARRRAPG